jgi:peroxiredoxin
MKRITQRGKNTRSNVMVAVVFIIIFVLAIGIALGTQRSTNPFVGQTAPAFELKNLDGKTVSSSEFKGKVVVLDFWATWCGPCRMEIPSFIQLQKKYEKKGFTFVGVSLDQDGPDVVRDFVKKTGMNYPQLMASYEIFKNYGSPDAIPTTFLIDRKGIIRTVLRGYHTQSVFESEIQKLLGEK